MNNLPRNLLDNMTETNIQRLATTLLEIRGLTPAETELALWVMDVIA